ncbi:enoyl-CoA hydratase-related protein [Parvibaculum sp.]|uniref:enoyl-CoA hydratase-related protein n=1 Tax=Parvibaculum sp. TaxID=2024848 RepID=UPI002730ED97|nr:enoyl-CoA hydratase-related protein [Parvibaculum sp.]MDP1627882.1 enoyl-CoA hydratase-related protein [Parvibaculum sp.]MDP2150880.1 enoyl-CoA hydratase-related protein [Parvibaculum sp.]MDP3327396.1 enoyl-CoA hydratase-related protein [Parvibaculum sp.]
METLTLETKDGIALLTLNRPEVLNSINMAFIADMREAVAKVAQDSASRVLLITGAGRGFCAGADLAAQGQRENGMSIGEGVAHGMTTGFNPMMRELYALPKPIVSAVNGVAAGGGVGLALAADIAIAAKSASFVQVFGPRLGLIPDLGCTWHLPRLVGRARALGLAMTGEKLPAETAAEWGLIWKCVADDALMDEAMAVATKLAKGPTTAFAQIRKAIDAAGNNGFSEQLDYERDVQGVLGDHPNFAEGVKAFLTKREPEFKA